MKAEPSSMQPTSEKVLVEIPAGFRAYAEAFAIPPEVLIGMYCLDALAQNAEEMSIRRRLDPPANPPKARASSQQGSRQFRRGNARQAHAKAATRRRGKEAA